MSTRGVRCAVMRGGTSKGLYFVADDLPADSAVRDEFLLQAMGSPDPRQIDGMGGAHPLTSKVAVVSPSSVPDADVDYLFLQVVPDRPIVTDQQNCGNILAGVGPFALRRGLVDVSPAAGEAEVRIHLVNTGGVAVARFAVHDGEPVEEAKRRSPACRAPRRPCASTSPTPPGARAVRCCRAVARPTRSRVSR